ncbi:MAG: hypothetical protein AAFQ53_17440, partial [Bacteroidota bacterium]
MRPRLVFSSGDPNGIGPEVVLKTLADPALREQVRPAVTGSITALRGSVRPALSGFATMRSAWARSAV